MRNEEWQKVEELLDAALELEPAERQRFLEASCAGAPALRREVESLLACEEGADGFLGAPALALAADFFDGDAPEDRAGQTVGHYRLVREIGRGGMGAVFLAERADGEFKQEVALKVVRRSLADPELARRFRREREILAPLNHPNIARLLDGGVSADGEPFLAMEYVEGVRIDDYCDAQSLPARARLRLFLGVCRAVAYAHQHLVVHRDIKPSNILVTKEGTPKLLDFGIAKLLDPVQAGEQTRTELRAFTPDYASPEQVAGGQVTTASDVYSLGLLLEDLLRGARAGRRAPRATGGWRSRGAGETVATNLPTKGDGRHAEAKSSAQTFVNAELKNIVAMARHEDPARRYSSAAQFAEDVQRYLDGLPVRAQKDSFTYRAGKFVRRNRAGVAAVAVALLSLVGGIVATAWQAQRATAQARLAAEQARRAQSEAAKSERVSQFFQNMLSYAAPAWYAPGRGQRGEVRVIEALDGVAGRIDAEFADQPDVRSELHRTVGDIYRTLGRYDAFLSHSRRAWEAAREAYGEQHPKVAYCLYYYAAGLLNMGDRASAEPLLRQAIEMMRATEAENANLPYMMQDLGGLLANKGETDAAEPLLREALEMFRRRYGDDHAMVAVSFDRLGQMYRERGELGQAEAMYREAAARHRRSSNQQLLCGALQLLGEVKIMQGEYAEAEAYLREALALIRGSLGEKHPDVARILDPLADVLSLRGEHVAAERLVESALELRRRAFPEGHDAFGQSWFVLGKILTRANRAARGEEYLRRALEIARRAQQQGHWRIAEAQGALGENLTAQKRYAEAEPLLVESHATLDSSLTARDPRTQEARHHLAALYEAWGKPARAAHFRESLSVGER